MLLIFYVSTNWRYFVNSSKQHYGFFNEEKQRVLTVFTLVYFYTYDRLLGGASTKTNCLDDP